MMDTGTLIASIAFLSAANQRFIEVTDWVWTSIAQLYLYVRKPESPASIGPPPGIKPDDMGDDAGGPVPASVNQKPATIGAPVRVFRDANDPVVLTLKGHIINLVSMGIGFAISHYLISTSAIHTLLPVLSMEHIDVATGQPVENINHRVMADLVIGMMLSGGTEGANSVVKWLQAAKDTKAAGIR